MKSDREQTVRSEGGAAEPSRSEVWRMFDRIAPRYDLLNRVLSFGRDVTWRKRMARHLPAGRPLEVLDLATGTADQLLFLLDAGADVRAGMGMDMAEQMLDRGRGKIAQRGLGERLTLRTGDATSIPAPADSFDVVTISFGIRNVVDVGQALREMARVLRPGGRALILEFSLPANRLVRGGHLFYLRRVLPRIGGWVSGDPRAYRYLNQTIETFPYGPAFSRLMRDAGFVDCQAHPLTLGVASIYQGDKPHGRHD